MREKRVREREIIQIFFYSIRDGCFHLSIFNLYYSLEKIVHFYLCFCFLLDLFLFSNFLTTVNYHIIRNKHRFQSLNKS